MSRETAALAEYAVGLEYEDISPAAVERAKDCIIDTVAVSVFGSGLPWSRIVADCAERSGPGGNATILRPELSRATPPMAALANGALSHAFEMDSLRQPSAGIHPGSALAVPGLAVAEDVGASGRELITAFVAGSEVLSRIGLAGRHSSEQLGFHAPGLTGPFGSAVVAGRLLGLDS
ncbi:MAG: MmgE/PrpD family protein, partial [Acidimicrobiales bacterium]